MWQWYVNEKRTVTSCEKCFYIHRSHWKYLSILWNIEMDFRQLGKFFLIPSALPKVCGMMWSCQNLDVKLQGQAEKLEFIMMDRCVISSVFHFSMFLVPFLFWWYYICIVPALIEVFCGMDMFSSLLSLVVVRKNVSCSRWLKCNAKSRPELVLMGRFCSQYFSVLLSPYFTLLS